MTFARNPPWLARILNSRGQTTGSGIAVDAGLVITCGHLEPFAGTETGTTVRVEFPFARHESEAVVVHHVYEPDGSADLAVLELRRPLPDDPETPLHRAVRFAGRKARLRGFPDRSEPVSPISNVELSGFSRPGWVQINPTGTRGWSVHKGFSGGPVWDDTVEAVIGMVVAKHAHDTGHLLTLDYLCELWPPLADHIRTPPVVGGTDAWHWWPRARGIQHDTETVWRFRGRHKAITEITATLSDGRTLTSTADNLPSREPATALSREPATYERRRPLIVTGSPGAGKSAVLARIVTTSHRPWAGRLPANDTAATAEPGSVDSAVHAQGKTALEVAQAIALTAGVHDLVNLNGFPAAMREAFDGRDRFGVVIDAVDEALDAEQAEAILADVITPLAEFSVVRVIAGSRRYLGTRQLLSTGYSDFDLLDLDEPEYFEPADLTAYTLATLRLEGEARHDNPYNDLATAKSLAREIAKRSERNFLVAGLTARAHGRYDTTAVAPEALTFTGKVDDAFRSYLARLDRFDGVEAGQLLTALAFAEAPGFTAELWAIAVKALDGITIDPRRLEAFARTGAASFLIDQSGDEGQVFRLFHQALIDVARHNRTRGDAAQDKICEARLTRAFLGEAQDSGWRAAPEYLRRSLAVHAARAELIDELLLDPEFLVHADPRLLLVHVMKTNDETARLHAAVLRAASGRLDPADSRQRRALLAYNARRFGSRELINRLTMATESREALEWNPQWSNGGRLDARFHSTLARLSSDVCELECVQVGDRSVVVTCELNVSNGPSGDPRYSRTYRIWDLATQRQLQQPVSTTNPDGWYESAPRAGNIVCFGVDGCTIAVTYTRDQPPFEGMCLSVVPEELARVDTPTVVEAMHGVIALMDYYGDPVAVVFGEPSVLRLRDLNNQLYIGRSVDLGSQGRLYSIGATAIIDGNPVIAVFADDEAMLWDLITGRRIDRPPAEAFGPLRHQACELLDGRFVALAYTQSAAAIVWDLATGERIGQPLVGLFSEENLGIVEHSTRVVFTWSDDGIFVVFRSSDGVLVWDVLSGRRLGDRLNDTGRFEYTLACARLNGRAVAVTAAHTDVLVWDLTVEALFDAVGVKSEFAIRGVASTSIDDCEIVIACVMNIDSSMWTFDAATGEAMSKTLSNSGEVFASLANAEGAGPPTVFTVTGWGLVQEWCARTWRVLGEHVLSNRTNNYFDATLLAAGHRLYVVRNSAPHLDVQTLSRTVLRSPRDTDEDPALGLQTGAIFSRWNAFRHVACSVVDERAIAVTTTKDGIVSVCDLDTREELSSDSRGYNLLRQEPVTALAFTKIDDRPTLFTGTPTGDVHVSDFATGRRLTTIPFNGPISALATLPDNRLVVASGGELSVFQSR